MGFRRQGLGAHRLLAAAALLGLGLVLAGACSPGGDDNGARDGGPRPLVVVGIDAANWNTIDPMIEQGELPHIAALRESGAHGDLLVLPPLSSPVVWTSFMTGHFGRGHGILDHTFPYNPGPKRRISSTIRRQPTLWNLASHFDRRSAAIGYYASHPVEMIDGVMVSDRADQVASGGVHPPELEAEIQAIKARLDAPQKLKELRSVYFPEPYEPGQANRPGSPFAEVIQAARRLDRGLRHEAFVTESALAVLERSFQDGEDPFEIFVVYLRMVDITCHTTWIQFDDSTFEEKSSDEHEALLGDCIPAAYRQADLFLGSLVRILDQGYGEGAYNLVALSDHGCGPATGKHAIGRKALQHMSGNHYPDGIVLGKGPDIARGEIARMDHMDVMPSLLALSSLPISKAFPGQIHGPLLRAGFLDERPPRYAENYRVAWQTAEADQASAAAESEELAALAALGYVDGATPVAQGAAGVDFDFWQAEERLINGTLIGEAMHHLIRERPEAFRALIAEVEENRPKLAPHFARVTRNWLNLWQESFPQPLISPEMRAELEGQIETARLKKAGAKKP